MCTQANINFGELGTAKELETEELVGPNTGGHIFTQENKETRFLRLGGFVCQENANAWECEE